LIFANGWVVGEPVAAQLTQRAGDTVEVLIGFPSNWTLRLVNQVAIWSMLYLQIDVCG
jgi:hypothetical protein